MKNKKIALQVIVITAIALSFIACDKDFTTLESDILNDDIATNFNFKSLRETNEEFTEVITYTKPLGPVQTNGLAINTLGIYDDDYGRVTSGFVVQPSLASFDPDFGDEVAIDSVVLTLPYSFTVVEVDEDSNIIYNVDSILPEPNENGVYKSIKLSLFESSYFIRDFNPAGDLNDPQSYFSNKTALISEDEIETISQASLENTPIEILPNPEEVNHVSLDENGFLKLNTKGYTLLGPEPDNEEEEQTVTRQSPGIRLKLDPNYWQTKIINQEGNAVLSSENPFVEYFRGIYFKAEPNNNNEGSFLILNTGNANANITIYYSRLNASTTDDEDDREDATFVVNLNANSINFLDNNFTTPLNEGDANSGDSRLYLKGGQGSIARIKLFNGDDINDGADESFDDWKNFFVETDPETGKFIRSKRLVNEANLVFYVDQNTVTNGEPDRIYLYNIDNKTPLVDYFLDGFNNILPSFSVTNHLGPLQRVDDEPNGEGIKYKFKITEHINNLLLRDSTNVELGLAVSLNVNMEESIAQRQVQSTDDSNVTIPISSVLSPRGTVLHGNNTEDETKRVYLEIYYTEPNN